MKTTYVALNPEDYSKLLELLQGMRIYVEGSRGTYLVVNGFRLYMDRNKGRGDREFRAEEPDVS